MHETTMSHLHILASDPTTPAELLQAYKNGWFPMSCMLPHLKDVEDAKKVVHWFSFDPRGVILLDEFKIPHGSKKLFKDNPYHITVDQDFEGVMHGCAELTDKPGRSSTWINEDIHALYTELYKQGHAHSVEVRDDKGALVGGLYGVSSGGVFHGESMFSRVPGASKLALGRLAEILKGAGYSMLDVQEVGPLTEQFGAKEISRTEYMQRLAAGLKIEPNPSEAFLKSAERVEQYKPLEKPQVNFRG